MQVPIDLRCICSVDAQFAKGNCWMRTRHPARSRCCLNILGKECTARSTFPKQQENTPLNIGYIHFLFRLTNHPAVIVSLLTTHLHLNTESKT